ncbi:MAG: glycerol-3-phosphate 1-O-acyltransferase PlsY [Rickettsiales bacterium]|jgi:glycerol-3-phosphate acyltransferase PlsY|nr:glycerol-3-phosphate 1-O-acyltransferase PlsY [Rickettsiales bacterium]
MVGLYVLICALIGYLIGSIPFGFILTRLFTNVDIRKTGSKATGATNVMRVNKFLAILTLILDFGKVWVALYLAKIVVSDSYFYMILAGVFAVIGHNFPVWLGFKGGKGFACTLAVISFISIEVFLFLIAVWLILFVLFGISSVSSLAVLVLAPFLLLFMGVPDFVFIGMLFLSLLGIFMHRQNIARLIKGEEFGAFSNKKKK